MADRSPVPPRLSAKETLVLDLLIEGGAMYGLQLVTASRRRLKRGTVYVTLGRMEDKGYVTSHQAPPAPDTGGLPRRLYEATPFGLRVHGAWSAAATHMRLKPAL